MNAVLLTLALAGCVSALDIQAGVAVRQMRLDPPGRFSVTYLHSMYHVPFTEEYVVDPDGSIRLDAVGSVGGTVSDYFALEGTTGEVRALERRFTSLSFLIGATQPQVLRSGTRTLSFRELGEPGTRVVFSSGTGCGIE
jgi:hypothetical protein